MKYALMLDLSRIWRTTLQVGRRYSQKGIERNSFFPFFSSLLHALGKWQGWEYGNGEASRKRQYFLVGEYPWEACIVWWASGVNWNLESFPETDSRFWWTSHFPGCQTVLGIINANVKVFLSSSPVLSTYHELDFLEWLTLWSCPLNYPPPHGLGKAVSFSPIDAFFQNSFQENNNNNNYYYYKKEK